MPADDSEMRFVRHTICTRKSVRVTLTSCNVRFDIAWSARNAPECAGMFAAMTDDAKESTLSESRFSDAANAAQPRDSMEQSSRSRDTEISDGMRSQGTGSAGMSGQGT